MYFKTLTLWIYFLCLALCSQQSIAGPARERSLTNNTDPNSNSHDATRNFGWTSENGANRLRGTSNRNTGQSNNSPRTNVRQNVPIRFNNALSVNRPASSKTFVTWLAAYIQAYMLGINCSTIRPKFTSESRCESLKQVPFEQMRLYATPRSVNTVYSVAIPEGKLRDHSSHQSVAVVDPFPTASFGHLVLVFYVDSLSKAKCHLRKGVYFDSLCLTQARRSRCRNHHRLQLSSEQLSRRCEINFIPTVYDHTQEPIGQKRNQVLECLPYIAGFGPCPKQVRTSSQINPDCELVANSKRCYETGTSAPVVQPRLCEFYELCDHAVTLFGGWNDDTMVTRHEDNLQRFYDMLRNNGFSKSKIQVFYNGNGNVPLNEPYHHGLPASNKNTLRNHVTSLCRTALCVDSLVLYLNGPTTSDGSMLLWDTNGDGEAQTSEKYTTDELLNDVADCQANNVFIFADQSYSGRLTTRLRQKSNSPQYPHEDDSWNNVVLLTSGGEYDYSWRDEISRHWSRLSPLYPVSWAYDALGYWRNQAILTSPTRAQDLTLYGAPIEQGQPVLAENWPELKRKYMGCQKLPPGEWFLDFSDLYLPAQE